MSDFGLRKSKLDRVVLGKFGSGVLWPEGAGSERRLRAARLWEKEETGGGRRSKKQSLT